jgi:hypothetical protein
VTTFFDSNKPTPISQQLSTERPRRSAEEINRSWPLFDWWYHAPRGHLDIFHISRNADPLAISQALVRPRWVCIAEDAPPELVAQVMQRATVLIGGRPLPRVGYNRAGALAFHGQRVALIELPVLGP